MASSKKESLIYAFGLLLLINGAGCQRSGGLLQPSGDRPIGVTPPSDGGNRVDNTRPLLQPFNGNVYNSHSSSSKRPPPGADLGPSQGSFQNPYYDGPQGSLQGSFQGSSQGQGHAFQFQSTGSSGTTGVTKTPGGVEVGGDKAPPLAGFSNTAQGSSAGNKPPGGVPPPGQSQSGPAEAPLTSSSTSSGSANADKNKDDVSLSLGGFGGSFLGSKDKISAAAQEASDPGKGSSGNPSKPSSNGRNTGAKHSSPLTAVVLLLPLLLHGI